jgi:flagellar biosynthetic protein FliR
MDVGVLSKYIPNFLFILLRASIFVSLLPFFGSRSFPAQFKIGFAIAIALVLTPVVEFEITESNIPILVFKEIIFGMALGLSVRFVFMAIDLAGQAISFSMGLAVANAFDPEFGQTAEVARLQGIIAMLLFLAMDAHHDLIYVFVKGYEFLPAGQANIRGLMQEGISLGSKVFIMAVKIAAPVMTGMLIASILFGFLYKAAPQINIFFVSFPVYIFLGFVLLLLSIPIFMHVVGGYFGEIREEMYRIFEIARG